MEKQRQVKILSIVALVIAIVGMSLGFAAFSTTLKITSSASVSPNSNDFKVVFSDSATSILGEGQTATLKGGNGGDKAENGIISSSKVSGLKGNFTNKGDMVDYLFYVHNVGEYDAYLKGVNIELVDGTGSTKVCRASTTDETKATDSLVQAACDDVHLFIMVGDYEYVVGDTNIVGHLLEKGTVQEVGIVIDYTGTSSLVDGPFDVTFGDLSLEFSTVDNELITFTIDDYVYQAVKGMTWEEWVQSEFNSRKFSIRSGTVFLEGEGYLYNYLLTSRIESSAEIINDEKYVVATAPIG